MANWQPSAGLEQLRRRAQVLAAIRQFFAQRDVMEVDVPALAPATVTDPHLESFRVTAPVPGMPDYYLMTSPEYYLKRLLTAGSGAVFSLAHAFRAEPASRRHSPEFMMLEWYRPGWSLQELMDEVLALVNQFVEGGVRFTSYRDAFLSTLSVDPHTASTAALKTLAEARLSPAFDSDDRSVWLDLLFSHLVEPGLQGVVFVTGFPAAQAALAQVQQDVFGNAVAARFELYINGVEIANGYQEEQDAAILEQRFADHLCQREACGQTVPDMDAAFLAALQAGLPACCGVALGIDRLIMQASGIEDIAGVMPFRV